MNFFINFLINYLASVASGLTLGGIGYLIYTKEKDAFFQRNIGGNNTVNKIDKQININGTKGSTSDIIKALQK